MAASALGGVASELEDVPESDPASVGVAALFGVDASADGAGGELFAVPPGDPPLPPREEPDELDELDEPEEPTELVSDAPPELLPTAAPESGAGEADWLDEPLPHAAMTIARPKHDAAFIDIHTVEYPCRRWNHRRTCQFNVSFGSIGVLSGVKPLARRIVNHS
jgi:hypothetical protein